MPRFRAATRTFLPYAIIVLLAVVLGDGDARTPTEAVGDRTQIILPAAAAVCSFGRSTLGETVARFAGVQLTVNTSKELLTGTTINTRPHGGQNGFPSGHTAAATFGAASLARTCLAESPVGQAAVFAVAAYTGYSRVEAGKHFLFQVIVGALVGFAGDRWVLRRPRSRSRFADAAMRLWRRLRPVAARS
jgi:membrane-associated phospholipid phosphatase